MKKKTQSFKREESGYGKITLITGRIYATQCIENRLILTQLFFIVHIYQKKKKIKEKLCIYSILCMRSI